MNHDRLRGITFFERTDVAQHHAGVRRGESAAPCDRSPIPADPEVDRFLDALLRRHGLDPAAYRRGPLRRRVGACLRGLRVRSLAEARAILNRDPSSWASAVNSLLIGVTSFFRDRDMYDVLDRLLASRRRESSSGLSIWSVGCSDGAELYSVAMLLAGRGRLDRCRLLGTDCRAAALVRAAAGWYGEEAMEAIEPVLRNEFFFRDGAGWRVVEPLRRAAEWQQADVLCGPPPRPATWDIILCRNVAIYLEPDACRGLWARLAGGLRMGGLLVVGKAECPPAALPLVRKGSCVFVRQPR